MNFKEFFKRFFGIDYEDNEESVSSHKELQEALDEIKKYEIDASVNYNKVNKKPGVVSKSVKDNSIVVHRRLQREKEIGG